MRSLEYYLALPWTVEREERYDDGHYLSLKVRELPGFVVAAPTEDQVEAMFWPALEAFLNSHLEDGEEPPVPGRTKAREQRREVAAHATPPEVTWDRQQAPHVEQREDVGFESLADAEVVSLAGIS